MVFANEVELDQALSMPSPRLIAMMQRLPGDITILGIAGKMGLTLGRRAINAINAAGVKKTVFGVSRFSAAGDRDKLEKWGIKTISCDLLRRDEVNKLPVVPNVIFMAGKKFGTVGDEESTWAMNTLVPGNVIEHFKNTNIVVFSTGCVYPLVGVNHSGCDEQVAAAPIGEYAQSCLGRERIFQYGAKNYGINVLLYRLNYAIDMRYGVLHDIAQQVFRGEPVNNNIGYFNVIWQGDANDIALLSLEHCTSPAAILNVTGVEIAAIKTIAEAFGKLFNQPVTYTTSSSELCYLSNAAKMAKLFYPPTVSMAMMIEAQADWLRRGGASLGKPTHFEVNTGKF